MWRIVAGVSMGIGESGALVEAGRLTCQLWVEAGIPKAWPGAALAVPQPFHSALSIDSRSSMLQPTASPAPFSSMADASSRFFA